MKRLPTLLAAIATITVFSVGALAQQDEIPPPPTPAIDSDRPDSFVEEWANIQGKRDRALSALGRGAQLQAVQTQVRNTIRKDPSFFVEATRASEIPELYYKEVAQYLLSLGIGPGVLPKAGPEAKKLIESAENVAKGTPTFADLQLLSEVVVIASPSSIKTDTSLDDGFNTTIAFDIIDTMKGSAEVGTSVMVRSYSNTPPNVEQVINRSDQFVLLLSKARYEYVATSSANQRREASEFFAEAFSPYKISGNALLPTGEGQPVPPKLSSIKEPS